MARYHLKSFVILAIVIFPFSSYSLANFDTSVSIELNSTKTVSYKTYNDPDKMLSKVQLADLDRVDWILPESLSALQISPQEVKEFKTAIDNVEYFTLFLNKLGPWTVTCKDQNLVPNGDVHEYVSFARYFWPVNSTAAGKEVDSTQAKRRHIKREVVNVQQNIIGIQQGAESGMSETMFPPYCAKPDDYPFKMMIWRNCPYENRDGQSNPDVDLIGDPIAFRSSCRAACLNAIMFGITGKSEHGERAAHFIRYFFLDPETAIKPELKYGQIIRGPARPGSDNDWTKGTFRAIVDWRHLIKAINAVIIMRGTPCPYWTVQDDNVMREWAKQYYTWLLEDQTVSYVARNKTNNIMSWWYGQAIALNILMDDTQTASSLIDEYIQGPFTKLIDENGDQPKETNRTRAVHYRAFGIEAMMVIMRMSAFLGKNEWNAQANISSTLNDAVRFSVTLANSNSTLDQKAELAPHVATALAVYGDTPDQLYSQYLASNDAYGDIHKNATWRLFNSPSFISFAVPLVNQSGST